MSGNTEKRAQSISELRELDARADKIRESLGISKRGEVIFQADLYEIDDDKVIVEADGYGGATLSVIEGNYPIDYQTKESKLFERPSGGTDEAEQEACIAAQEKVNSK